MVVCDVEVIFNICIVYIENELVVLLECQKLVLIYGLNDFVGLSFVSYYDCVFICKLIQQVIVCYELCLQQVQVMFELNEQVINVLYFVIQVLFVVYLVEELVSFDVML